MAVPQPTMHQRLQHAWRCGSLIRQVWFLWQILVLDYWLGWYHQRLFVYLGGFSKIVRLAMNIIWPSLDGRGKMQTLSDKIITFVGLKYKQMSATYTIHLNYPSTNVDHNFEWGAI